MNKYEGLKPLNKERTGNYEIIESIKGKKREKVI